MEAVAVFPNSGCAAAALTGLAKGSPFKESKQTPKQRLSIPKLKNSTLKKKKQFTLSLVNQAKLNPTTRGFYNHRHYNHSPGKAAVCGEIVETKRRKVAARKHEPAEAPVRTKMSAGRAEGGEATNPNEARKRQTSETRASPASTTIESILPVFSGENKERRQPNNLLPPPMCVRVSDADCVCVGEVEGGSVVGMCSGGATSGDAKWCTPQGSDPKQLLSTALSFHGPQSTGLQVPNIVSEEQARAPSSLTNPLTLSMRLRGGSAMSDNVIVWSRNLGGCISNENFEGAVRCFKYHKVGIVCVQELGASALHTDIIKGFHASAADAGYTLHLAAIPKSRTFGGTAILVANSLTEQGYTVDKVVRGLRGGVICLTISHSQLNTFRIASVYAPQNKTESRAEFFNNLAKYVNSRTILAGDFNCVLDPTLDLKRPGAVSPYENSGASELQQIISSNNLRDSLREGLGNEFEYTCKTQTQTKNGPGVCLSRLDRIYTFDVPDALWAMDVHYAMQGSHHPVSATLTFEAEEITKTKRELPKVNEQLILEPKHNAKLISFISEMETDLKNSKMSITTINKQLKHKVRTYLIAETKKSNDKKYSAIRKQNEYLEAATEQLKNMPSRRAFSCVEAIEDKIKDLKKIVKPPTAQRSYTAVRKDDAMTAELWKSAFGGSKQSQRIPALNKIGCWNNPPPKNSDLPEKTNDVSNEAAKYFSHLAKLPNTTTRTKRCERVVMRLLKKGKRVNKSTSDICGQTITDTEIVAIMRDLPTGKSAGPDRIPNMFYKTFAGRLAPMLARLFNHGRDTKKFPADFTEGIVTLLYKKGVRSEVRNYRPITLLNSDYKLLTRTLAQRMLKLVPEFVSKMQIGFVPNTIIMETTVFLKLLQSHLDNIDEGGVLVFLDMEKAFDRVSWRYLKKACRALGFTDDLMAWIETLYNEKRAPKRRIYTNGKFSKKYNVNVGTAQGCPLSPLLFLPVMEALTRLLASDSKLKGIMIGSRDHRSNHFADDSIAALANIGYKPRLDINSSIFCSATNMAENMEKREILGVGTTGHVDPSTLTNDTTCWKKPGEYVISLGAPIGNDCGAFSTFHEKKVLEAKGVLVSARFIESISISGRSKLLNGNYYGKQRYWWSFMTPPAYIVKANKTDAANFLWRRSPELDKSEIGSSKRTGKFCSKDVEYRPIKKGGCGILHLDNHMAAFKASWIFRLYDTRDALYKEIVSLWIAPLSTTILIAALTAADKKAILAKIPNEWFTECIRAFWKLDLKPHLDFEKIKNPEEVESIPILRNHIFHVRMTANSEATWRHPIMSNLGDLINQDTRKFYNKSEVKALLQEHQNLSGSSLATALEQHEKIISAIPKALRTLLQERIPQIQQGETIYFRETHPGGAPYFTERYGRLISGNRVELYSLDSTRYPNIVRTKKITQAMYKTMKRAHCTVGKEKERQPIVKRESYSYPLNIKWLAKGSKDPLSLHQFTIKRITSLLPKPTPAPNSHAIYNTMFAEKLPWKVIHANQTGYLTSPRDNKVAQKILHKKLFLRNADSNANNKKCRFCNKVTESIRHVPMCPETLPLRKLAFRFMGAMGYNTEKLHTLKTWIFGINEDNKPLTEPQRDVRLLTLRVLYRHMQLKDRKNIKLNIESAKRELAYALMKRILNFQMQKRRFYMSRKNSTLPTEKSKHILPEEAAARYSGIGKLNVRTGRLTVNHGIRDILKEYGVWSPFNSS